jgi:hypothetical protein
MRARRLGIAPVVSMVVIPLAVAAAATHEVSVRLRHPLPAVVHAGQTVTISGHVRGAPAGTDAALQARTASGWNMLARVSVRSDGAFTLRWAVGKRTGLWTIRVAALNHGRVLAATHSILAGVSRPPVYCSPAAPPAVNIPVGDGWITGGDYLEGGPFPGIVECESQGYTVTATNMAGVAVASETVAGGHSYTLVVPAGTYTLRATQCGTGSATVTAGRQTRADLVCPVP